MAPLSEKTKPAGMSIGFRDVCDVWIRQRWPHVSRSSRQETNVAHRYRTRSLSSLFRSPSSGHLSVQVTVVGSPLCSGHFVRSHICSGHRRQVTPLFRSPSSGHLSVQVTPSGHLPLQVTSSGHLPIWSLRQVTSLFRSLRQVTSLFRSLRQVTSLFRSPSSGHLVTYVQITSARSPLCSCYFRKVTSPFMLPPQGHLSVQVASERSLLCSGCIRQVTSLFRSPLFFVLAAVQVSSTRSSSVLLYIHSSSQRP